LIRNGNSRSFAFVSVKLDGDAFRNRAKECRDVANGTKDPEAQRELRELATELDGEADKMDAEGRGED
jgi:hypothetical protein